jgi:PAS domain S-box-containing protein
MGVTTTVANHISGPFPGGVDVLSGLALLVTMATIAWGIRLLRRVRDRHDRILVGCVGLVSAYQGLRLTMEPSGWAWAANACGVVVCLTAMAVLRGISSQRRTAEMALRLAEANARPAGKSEAAPILEGRLVLGSVPAWHDADVPSTLLDAAPIAMFAVGVDGLINYWNPAAEQTLGWRRDEVLGQKMPNNMVARWDASTVDGVVCLVGKDGSRINGPVKSVPVRNSRGIVSGILTIVMPYKLATSEL